MEGCEEPIGQYGIQTHKHNELTGQIIGVFYDVYNALGHGFLEKVYENAFSLRLRKAGLKAVQQQSVTVYFDGEIVGEYFADVVVDETIIVKLKAAMQLTPEHHAQLLNYLRATRYEVGLLLNFGPKAEVVRKAYDNARKKIGGRHSPTP